MANVKIVDNPVDSDYALQNLCSYIVNPAKASGDNVFGRRLDPYNAYEDICEAQSLFEKSFWRMAYHIVLSFEDRHAFIDDDVMEIAYRFSGIFAPEYQVLCGIHTDTTQNHAHFAVSTVSLMGGNKYHIDYDELNHLRAKADRIEEEYLNGK